MTPDQLDRLQLAILNMVLLDDGDDPITLAQLQAENAKDPTEAAEQRAKVEKLAAAVLDNAGVELNPTQLVIEPWPAPAASFKVGMPKGVKIKHFAGVEVICDTERSMHMNRRKALRAMRLLLADHPEVP